MKEQMFREGQCGSNDDEYPCSAADGRTYGTPSAGQLSYLDISEIQSLFSLLYLLLGCGKANHIIMWSTFQYFRRHVRIDLSFTATSEDIVFGVIPERAIEYQRNEFSYLEFA